MRVAHIDNGHISPTKCICVSNLFTNIMVSIIVNDHDISGKVVGYQRWILHRQSINKIYVGGILLTYCMELLVSIFGHNLNGVSSNDNTCIPCNCPYASKLYPGVRIGLY